MKGLGGTGEMGALCLLSGCALGGGGWFWIFAQTEVVQTNNPSRRAAGRWRWSAPDPHSPWGDLGVLMLLGMLNAWHGAAPGGDACLVWGITWRRHTPGGGRGGMHARCGVPPVGRCTG